MTALSRSRGKIAISGMSALIVIGALALHRRHEERSTALLKPEMPTSHERSTAWPIPVVIETVQGPAVVLHETREWRLVRHAVSGYLDVYRRSDPDAPWELVSLPVDWRKNTYPLAATASLGGLVVVGYDVVENLASGRKIGVSRNVVDVDLIMPEMPQGHPIRLGEALDLGGFDSRYEVHALPDGVVVSSANRVVSIRGTETPRPWRLEPLADRELVELAFDGERAAAIVRRLHDDRTDGALADPHAIYELGMLEPGGMTIRPIDTEGIPWRVRLAKDGPAFDLARSPEELSGLLSYDLGRLAFAGIQDFGGNNLEGRLAWSQAYYLDGLLEAVSGHLAGLRVADTEDLKTRVRKELHLVAELARSEWPGLRCQRYSIDREPLLFALHLGRTLRLLEKAIDVLGEHETLLAARKRIRDRLEAFEDTVERPDQIRDGTHVHSSFAYRRGVAFWADGCNVPYNYVSGVVDGLLHANVTTETVDRCVAWMEPLLTLEFRDRFRPSWRYWWGLGDRGWTAQQGVSLNTPDFYGNRGALAHISYRSMDASALLMLEQQRPGSLPDGLVDHLRNLVEEGWLWPWVSGSFGDLAERPGLSPAVARRHARAASAFEIQAQVWALDQLAGDARGD